jgi:small subunit ribosomal protein S3Ae
MARRPTTKKKIKGKIWFSIHAPKVFNEAVIGETVGKEEESVNGRNIKIPLSEVNGDITKRHVQLKLKIAKVTGEHAYTEIVGYELSRPYLQRMIRRRSTKIEIVKDLKLKDGKLYRIKLVAITLHKANSSQRAAVTHALAEEIEKIIPNYDIDSLVVTLSTNKLQREIQKKVNKIYPIRYVDIRKIEAKKEKKEIIKR